MSTLVTVGPGEAALMSSPNTIPATFSVPAACVGSPMTMATVLLVVSGNSTASRLPVGVPVMADETISTRSLPFAGSKENGLVKGTAKSKGQGAGPLQPGEDSKRAAFDTVVASGP